MQVSVGEVWRVRTAVPQPFIFPPAASRQEFLNSSGRGNILSAMTLSFLVAFYPEQHNSQFNFTQTQPSLNAFTLNSQPTP